MPEPLLTDPTSVVRLPRRSAAEEIRRKDFEDLITQLIAEGQGELPPFEKPGQNYERLRPFNSDERAVTPPVYGRNLPQVPPQPRFVPGLGTPQEGISPSSAGLEHAGPMSARATTQLQPGGMDQMGFAEQMAAREEIARALNGTGGSNMLTRLFGMDR